MTVGRPHLGLTVLLSGLNTQGTSGITKKLEEEYGPALPPQKIMTHRDVDQVFITARKALYTNIHQKRSKLTIVVWKRT